MKHIHLLALLGASLLISACGDSGGISEPAPPTAPPVGAANEVPPNATASLANFVNYLNTTPGSEVAEPLLIDKATPLLSETDEPLAVS
jgi:hypothetical protein